MASNNIYKRLGDPLLSVGKLRSQRPSLGTWGLRNRLPANRVSVIKEKGNCSPLLAPDKPDSSRSIHVTCFKVIGCVVAMCRVLVPDTVGFTRQLAHLTKPTWPRLSGQPDNVGCLYPTGSYDVTYW
jgi:hypothetical protein